LNTPQTNIENREELIEKIAELFNAGWDLRRTDAAAALGYAVRAAKLSLGLKPFEDIYKTLSEKSFDKVVDKNLVAKSLYLLSYCEIETAKFDNGIACLNAAIKFFTELEDRETIAKCYLTLGSAYVNKGEFQNALTANLAGLKIAQEDGNVENIMILLSNTGLTYWNLGDMEKSFEFLSESLEYKRKKGDKLDIAKTLNNLGLVYNATGDYLKALETYKEAFNIVEEVGEKKGVGILYMNIGLIYDKLGETEKAEVFLYKALEAYKNANYKKGIGECLVNISLVKRAIGDIETAMELANESYKVAEEIGDKKVIGFAYQELMHVMMTKKEYKKALEYGLKSYEVRKQIEHRAGIMENCGTIGEILMHMNENEKALQFLMEGMKIGLEAGFKHDLSTTYFRISNCYELMGDYKKAVEYLKKHIETRDIVFNEESQKKIRNVQAKFEVEHAQRESEIYKLKNIDLVDANKKLEDMNQEKDEFLNLVSHDLKNPLNSVYGFSTLLVQDFETLSKEEVLDFSSNINISSMVMLDLINDILNANLIESGKYELRPELVDLNTLIHSLITMNKFQLQQKDIKIVFTDNPSAKVLSDLSVIRQILSNLVSNAIKFSPMGKKVYVSIAFNKIPYYTSVEIVDEGPGMSQEDKSKLFTKFAKLSARPTAGESSTGLGLSIVKKLTGLINGKIECESELGKGAKFILHIPQKVSAITN